MVVKSRLRKPHRPLCLCCAETGALPFSLRRATGDVDHTWDGADDDDGDDESISTRARVSHTGALFDAAHSARF
jgi:hypothetical protein